VDLTRASVLIIIMDLEIDERALQSLEIPVKGLENVPSTEALGTGSFGSVYKVEAFGLPCIAKCIHPVLIRYEQQIQRSRHDMGIQKRTIRKRFYEECLLLSKLRHPNIVQFMGVARVSNTGEWALIMEALFSDLGNLVEQHKELSDPIKISLMLDIANGLLYLHSQNPPVIHRDLSAANILISLDLRGKIADLGVAKFLDIDSDRQTVQPGAYAYMAPEALLETPQYGTKLDIFSYGAVLLYVINCDFPKVYEPPSYVNVKQGQMQIARRMKAVKSAEGHCLYSLAIQCLHDQPDERPNTEQVRNSVKSISINNPRKQSLEYHKVNNAYLATILDIQLLLISSMIMMYM
jgi:serine/threonine protein kinase